MISVIVIALNEERVIKQTLVQLLALRDEADIEILLVDGGSTDRTVEIGSRYVTVVQGTKGRAQQLNRGAVEAKGDILFFVHADMFVPRGAIAAIKSCIDSGCEGGGFSNQFDRYNRRIKLLGRILNLRLFGREHTQKKGLFFGDNGIFVSRTAYVALGGFNCIPIMEDYDFSWRLRRRGRVGWIRNPILTVSSRRHEKEGFLRTRLQWIAIKVLYRFGVPPIYLARLYPDSR